MTRSALLLTAFLSAGSAAAQDQEWYDTINIDAALAQEMARMDIVLGYHDLANYIGVIQGQVGVAEANAHVNALGAWFHQNGIADSHFAEAQARLGAAIAGYLNAVGQAAASSNSWPGGAAQQQSAFQLLNAANASYPRFLQSYLDPTLLIMQVALVAGWARGESQVANPFAGHLQRIQNAYPDAGNRAVMAAAAGPLPAIDGTLVAPSPVPPPAGAQGASTVTGPQGGGQTRSLFDDLLQQAGAGGGLQYDIDLPGMDITSFDLPSADPMICLTACQDYGGCQAFTYVKPGVQGAAPRCWLKSSVPAPVPSSCCVSGTP